EKLIAAIGLESRYAHSARHVECLQDLSCSRIDSPQIAFVTFPSAVPKLTVDPGDSGDEAVRLNRAKNRARVGIDLMNLSISILPDPERPFCPRKQSPPPPPGAGIVASTAPVFGSIFWMRPSAS